MDEVVKAVLIYGVIPTVVGLGAWFMKNVFERLEKLEKIQHEKLDEAQVRQIVADKIEPIREDMHDLKITLNKIYDLLIRQ